MADDLTRWGDYPSSLPVPDPRDYAPVGIPDDRREKLPSFPRRFMKSLWKRHGAQLVGLGVSVPAGAAAALPFLLLADHTIIPGLATLCWAVAVIVAPAVSMLTSWVSIPAAYDAIHGQGAWERSQVEQSWPP